MNVESKKSDVPKRKIISIPFLLIAVVLVVGGYPAGKWVMKQVMIKQEKDNFSGEATAPDGIGEDGHISRTGLAAMAEQRNSMGRPAGGDGGGGGERGQGGGGNFDPKAAFARRDADSNGKLEGDEITERMKGRLEAMDTDKDGAVSEDEFLEAMKNRRGGGNGGEGRSRPENDDSDDDDSDGDSDDDDAGDDKDSQQ